MALFRSYQVSIDDTAMRTSVAHEPRMRSPNQEWRIRAWSRRMQGKRRTTAVERVTSQGKPCGCERSWN